MNLTVKPRVLVAAASRHNGTREIAGAITAGLAERGIRAEARDVDDVTDLRHFRAVVLGSAIYVNRWLPEARRFAQIHASELCMRPVWLFSSGPLGDRGHLIPEGESVDAAEITRATKAREHRLFAGHLDRSHLGLAERAVVRAVHAAETDSRDWQAVDRYASEIAGELS